MPIDAPPPGHDPGEGGFLSTITQRWGPFPIWVYVAIPAVAYVAYAYYRAKAEPEEEGEFDFTPEDEYLNVGGYPDIGGYPDFPDGTPNDPPFEPDTYTNAEWMNDAVRWAISQNINGLVATRAATAYLYKRPPTLNSGELAALRRMIEAKGPAPEGSPIIPPLDTGGGPPDDRPTTAPKPPGTVNIRLANGKVNATWNPSPTPNVTYEVEKRVGATPWRLIERTQQRHVQFESRAGSVQVRVRARNPRGFSKYSTSPVLKLGRSTEPTR
jgi:hypothetical protein